MKLLQSKDTYQVSYHECIINHVANCNAFTQRIDPGKTKQLFNITRDIQFFFHEPVAQQHCDDATGVTSLTVFRQCALTYRRRTLPSFCSRILSIKSLQNVRKLDISSFNRYCSSSNRLLSIHFSATMRFVLTGRSKLKKSPILEIQVAINNLIFCYQFSFLTALSDFIERIVVKCVFFTQFFYNGRLHYLYLDVSHFLEK